MSDGPSYLVHQPDGTTFGPADVAMLKEWVAAGIVTKTTALSLQGDDRKTPAAVVPGLFEPEQQGQATAQPAEPMYQAHLASGTTDAVTLADLGRMVEVGDVVSTTPISLMGGTKKVPAAVVPGLEDEFRPAKAQQLVRQADKELEINDEDCTNQGDSLQQEENSHRGQSLRRAANSRFLVHIFGFFLFFALISGLASALILNRVFQGYLRSPAYAAAPRSLPDHGLWPMLLSPYNFSRSFGLVAWVIIPLTAFAIVLLTEWIHWRRTQDVEVDVDEGGRLAFTFAVVVGSWLGYLFIVWYHFR